MIERPQALVIGGGPAGLMAAEGLAQAGHSVIITEAKPTMGRKLLMAGKSGLNITKDVALDDFMRAYDKQASWLSPMLKEFGPQEMVGWCQDLGQDVFTGSSGRVFPSALKASGLLRAWLARIERAGVVMRPRWRWQGWANSNQLSDDPQNPSDQHVLHFETPQGPEFISPRICVLALGGASWPRLGSDAGWVPWLQDRGVEIAPFTPANMGVNIAFSPYMTAYFGHPLKGIAIKAGTKRSRGEIVLSRKGLEGGGIYALSPALRAGAPLTLDMAPDLSAQDVMHRLGRSPVKHSRPNRLRKFGISPAAIALIMEFGRDLPLEVALKSLPIPYQGLAPLSEAISSAGGICRHALSPSLEINALPGMFACGEMLDWEAPTGGYLLTACWATGRWAGQGAAACLKEERTP